MKKCLVRAIAVMVALIDIALTAFVMYKITEPFAWWIVMLIGMVEAVILAVVWDFLTEVDGFVYRRRYGRTETPYEPSEDNEDNEDDEDDDEADSDDDDWEDVDDETFSEALDNLKEASTATCPEWVKREKAHDLQWLLDGKNADYEVTDAEEREAIAKEIEELEADCDETLADMFEGELKDIVDRFGDEYDEWRNSLTREWYDGRKVVEKHPL